MNILAIELGKVTRLGLKHGACNVYGLKDFMLEKEKTYGEKLDEFKDWIGSITSSYGVDIVAFNEPKDKINLGHNSLNRLRNGLNRKPNKLHMDLVSKLKAICKEKKIPYKAIDRDEVKKYFPRS